MLLVVAAASASISIHALRVEGDKQWVCDEVDFGKFLSTPSGWRATIKGIVSGIKDLFLSTPSGWRATIITNVAGNRRAISIHALRVEGDAITTR